MKGMRYMINLKDGKIPEMAIHVENYQSKNVILFMNQKDGAFALELAQGKSRLDLVDKETTEVFDASNDNYLIIDLLDAIKNVHGDTVALMKRYFKLDPKTPTIKEK